MKYQQPHFPSQLSFLLHLNPNTFAYTRSYQRLATPLLQSVPYHFTPQNQRNRYRILLISCGSDVPKALIYPLPCFWPPLLLRIVQPELITLCCLEQRKTVRLWSSIVHHATSSEKVRNRSRILIELSHRPTARGFVVGILCCCWLMVRVDTILAATASS